MFLLTKNTPFFAGSLRMFSTNVQSRIYGEKVSIRYPEGFGKNLQAGAQYIKVNRRKMPVRVDKQPIPLHDYINFKQMKSGNEILLNLDNCDNLRNGELVSGLIELARRDKNQEHDWNHHAIVLKCMNELRQRLPRMNSKNVIQAPLLLQNLKIIDASIWHLASKHALRLLHKYKDRDMAVLLDLYDRDILDQEGEPHLIQKTDSEFFERVAGILPMNIKHLNNDYLIRVLEVCVKRGVGSDRLFRDYLLLKIERNIMKLSIGSFIRLVRALADKQYVEDNVFWNEYVFRYIHSTTETGSKQDIARTYSDDEARKVWDALIFLKLKCPSLDVKSHIAYVETFIKNDERGAAETTV